LSPLIIFPSTLCLAFGTLREQTSAFLIDFNKFVQNNQIFSMSNKKWAIKRITVNLALDEAKKLEKYCGHTGRPATDVIRELIRGLSVTRGE
jgi:hypothetical protein